MLYTLSITNLIRGIDRHPYFNIEPNCRWIYCVSSNEPSLQNFKSKVESFTPLRYLSYIRVEVLPFDNLSEDDIQSNNLRTTYYEFDKFYTEGVVNRNYNLSYNYEDFTPDKWDFLNWRTDRLTTSY